MTALEASLTSKIVFCSCPLKASLIRLQCSALFGNFARQETFIVAVEKLLKDFEVEVGLTSVFTCFGSGMSS